MTLLALSLFGVMATSSAAGQPALHASAGALQPAPAVALRVPFTINRPSSTTSGHSVLPDVLPCPCGGGGYTATSCHGYAYLYLYEPDEPYPTQALAVGDILCNGTTEELSLRSCIQANYEGSYYNYSCQPSSTTFSNNYDKTSLEVDGPFLSLCSGPLAIRTQIHYKVNFDGLTTSSGTVETGDADCGG